MSSTPLLERTTLESEGNINWIDVEPPREARRMPGAANVVLAIASLKESILRGDLPEVAFDLDDSEPADEDQIAAARYAAQVWED